MNTFGTSIKITVFGQSHADAIGVAIDGLPAGTDIDIGFIQHLLDLRAPGKSDTATRRREPDNVEFLSGVIDGKTCGTSLCAVIRNTDTRSKDYSSLIGKPRPSHADFPAMIKYGENYDIRGGGQFSGRLTAPLCIAGGIALPLLEKRGIRVAAHIASVADVCDEPFDFLDDQTELMERLSDMPFAVIDAAAGERMKERIRSSAAACDSLGGVVECKITGLPVGTGLPMFDGIENVLSRAVFAVPAVKGIEFGVGFAGTALSGAAYNDAYYYDESGRVRTKTNHAGGICGGMATGMPVIFRAAVKPTPSIARKQDTVNLATGENTVIEIHGRHDPCIVPRAVTALRAVSAAAILDLLMTDGKF